MGTSLNVSLFWVHVAGVYTLNQLFCITFQITQITSIKQKKHCQICLPDQISGTVLFPQTLPHVMYASNTMIWIKAHLIQSIMKLCPSNK